MLIIRTAEELACTIAAPSGPEIASILRVHADRLAEFDNFELSDLALFAIIQPGDTLESVEDALNWRLTDGDGGFIQPPEIVSRHAGWYEVVFILSDDGYGLVLLLPIQGGTEPKLLAACNRAYEEFTLMNPMAGHLTQQF